MSQVLLSGRPASPGLALGRVVVLAAPQAKARSAGDQAGEAAALKGAISAACADLAALARNAAGDGADMLAFQIAMLEDDALSESAFAAIAAGRAATAAWTEALDAEIGGYEAADDEHFRARASDLADIRDRVLAHLTGSAIAAIPPGSIVFADDIAPSRFLATDWTGGAIVLAKGSPTSHVAMLARARGVPMVVGLERMPGAAVPIDCEAIVDGTSGSILLKPNEADRRAFAERRDAARDAAARAEAFRLAPAVTKDGTAIAVMINVADAREVDGLDPRMCDGIGLVRTELLFEGHALPDEETQYRAYRRLAEWAGGKPVTIRTLDAGGDKPIAGLTAEGESNPFLGVRGVRLTLQHPDVFRTQLRALARAAVHGAVEIMVPMVTVPAELTAARALLDEAVAALAAGGVPHRRPLLGMMVEVPAAAIAVDLFDADFFSIGSNDLTQYVTAAGRDIAAVADLADPAAPAVLRLIRQVARHGAQAARKVSLCGDAGGDAAMIPKLLEAGVRVLSVSPGLVGATKAAIAAVDLAGD